jgi:hypothetical protein
MRRLPPWFGSTVNINACSPLAGSTTRVPGPRTERDVPCEVVDPRSCSSRHCRYEFVGDLSKQKVGGRIDGALTTGKWSRYV